MGFMNQKRNIDTVSLISVVFAAVILTFFSSWLYYSNQTEKMKSSYETKVEILRSGLGQLQAKNAELEKKIEEYENIVPDIKE